MTADATNPTSTSAGVFGGQVLALKLNVDFGNVGPAVGFSGGVGNLVLNDSTSPLNGYTVSQILAVANTALGGGSIPAGLTISSLNDLVNNLNQSFDEVAKPCLCLRRSAPCCRRFVHSNCAAAFTDRNGHSYQHLHLLVRRSPTRIQLQPQVAPAAISSPGNGLRWILAE